MNTCSGKSGGRRCLQESAQGWGGPRVDFHTEDDEVGTVSVSLQRVLADHRTNLLSRRMR